MKIDIVWGKSEAEELKQMDYLEFIARITSHTPEMLCICYLY